MGIRRFQNNFQLSPLMKELLFIRFGTSRSKSKRFPILTIQILVDRFKRASQPVFSQCSNATKSMLVVFWLRIFDGLPNNTDPFLIHFLSEKRMVSSVSCAVMVPSSSYSLNPDGCAKSIESKMVSYQNAPFLFHSSKYGTINATSTGKHCAIKDSPTAFLNPVKR